MFTLLNVYNRQDITIQISHNGETIEFIIKSIVNKRNKDEMMPERNMELINSYLEYKGKEFKDKLFELYKKCEIVLEDTLTQREIYPLPSKPMHDILDMFDYNDVYLFMKDVYKIEAPKELKDTFDTKSEDDQLWTRVQTYIKDDFTQLAALATILKSILGPIGHYGYMKNNDLGKLYKEYILFNIIKSHPIYDVEPFKKLYGLISRIIVTNTKGEGTVESDIRVIEKQIPREDLALWVLSVVTLQKIMISPIIVSKDSKNIITRIYTFTRNKISPRGDVSNVIRPKRPMLDESGGEEESIVEAFRLASMPIGFTEEMIWGVSDIDFLRDQLLVEYDSELYYEALSMAKSLTNITPTQVYIVGWIIKDIVDPRTLHYIPLDNLKPLFGLVFTYLWQYDFKLLALFILSNYIESDVMLLNITSTRNQIPQEYKDRLAILYPHNRVVVSSKEKKSVNLAERSISLLSDYIFKGQWMSIVEDRYLQEVGFTNKVLKIPGNLKVLLTELLIHIEEKKDHNETVTRR